ALLVDLLEAAVGGGARRQAELLAEGVEVGLDVRVVEGADEGHGLAGTGVGGGREGVGLLHLRRRQPGGRARRLGGDGVGPVHPPFDVAAAVGPGARRHQAGQGHRQHGGQEGAAVTAGERPRGPALPQHANWFAPGRRGPAGFPISWAGLYMPPRAESVSVGLPAKAWAKPIQVRASAPLISRPVSAGRRRWVTTRAKSRAVP